jgi:hypothetical protein
VLEQQGRAPQHLQFESRRPIGPNPAQVALSAVTDRPKSSTRLVTVQDGETLMKKFLALYMADASGMAEMMRNSTPEQRKKGTEAWMKWMEDNKASLADRGAPVGKTKRIDAKGIKDAKNDVCGYSIVQAESADEAARIFGKDQPFLQMPGATIDMIEIMEMPAT